MVSSGGFSGIKLSCDHLTTRQEEYMRKLERTETARPASDGAGVRIHRLAGPTLHELLNPFLMIDEINSEEAADYIGGFPEHPHRGFETITYMKAGRMRHRDHMGNEGVIGAGDVQWMTAAAGVLHSEMPEQEEGLLHGFQIWLNLPAAEKMKPAAYRDLRSNDIARFALANRGVVSAIAGKVSVDGHALDGPISGLSTAPVLLDVVLAPGQRVDISFDGSNRALVFVYQGSTSELRRYELGVYSADSVLQLTAGAEGAQALVLSGRPLTDPVVQYGPFVMNTQAQIEQALRDYRNDELVKPASARAR
jgi:redox-sensitive bicupin YhaK (pirin superfamily)